MTMRAAIERSAPQPVTEWGQPAPPAFMPFGDPVPCFAWSSARKEVRDDGKEVVVEDLRAIVPSDADVQTGDRIAAIRNRRDALLMAGPMAVETVTRRGASGSNPGHLELMLVRHKQGAAV